MSHKIHVRRRGHTSALEDMLFCKLLVLYYVLLKELVIYHFGKPII